MTFTGLRIAIGGASLGVGEACARLLATRGARLALCARTQKALDALVDELQKNGADVFGVVADLGTDAGAEKFAQAAHQNLGGLDAALICAGISSRPKLLTEMDRAELLLQIQGNTIASALAAAALVRAWDASAQPGSSSPNAPSSRQILVLSSLVTRRPMQPGLSAYSAAKIALDSLVRALAEETWPRVRVNALCLGPVATRLHEEAGTPPEVIAQFPTPGEIAPLVLELLGERMSGLSGRCIDAERLAEDPDGALFGDGRLAALPPLQPPPSMSIEPPPEVEPGRAPSPRMRAALRATAAKLAHYPTDAHLLARRLAELHRVDPDSILLSGGGATALLEATLSAVAGAGDEVVTPFPTFEVLSALASRLGLRHRPVPTRQRPDGLFAAHSAADLLRAIGPRTRALYIATPDNPTGAQLSREEEQALRAGLVAKTVLVLDEAWSMEVPGDERAMPLGAELRVSAIRLRSLSKLHGLAGLRVGYGIATPELASLIRRLELPFPLGTPQIAASLAALEELPRARRIAQLLTRRRARLAQGIRALGLLASDGSSPLILVRDPRKGARAAPLLFALRAAELPAQESHWDAAALTLSASTAAQERKTLAALARALDLPTPC